MQELKSGLSTQTKIQVFRFIESGIGMPSANILKKKEEIEQQMEQQMEQEYAAKHWSKI
jgi:hypothetical protein